MDSDTNVVTTRYVTRTWAGDRIPSKCPECGQPLSVGTIPGPSGVALLIAYCFLCPAGTKNEDTPDGR